MPTAQKKARANVKPFPAKKRAAPSVVARRSPKTGAEKEAIQKAKTKADRIELLTAIGDAESPTTQARRKNERKKKDIKTPAPADVSETQDATEVAAGKSEELKQESITETALQAVRDNEASLRDAACDPDMINALNIAEEKLAAIAGSTGVASESPRAGLDIRRSREALSEVRQPEILDSLRNTTQEEQQKLKRPVEKPEPDLSQASLPEPEPNE